MYNKTQLTIMNSDGSTNFAAYMEDFGDIEYKTIIWREDTMRKGMNKTKNMRWNREKYYNLIKVTNDDMKNAEMWAKYTQKRNTNVRKNKNLLLKRYQNFNFFYIYNYSRYKELLNKICKQYKDNIFVAGGAAFNKISGGGYDDIDLFIHSCDINEYDKILRHIIEEYKAYFSKSWQKENITAMRTEHAITISSNGSSKLQIILRLYQSPSEIIHGFDVDSCCVGFDESGFYLTERALFAILNGYNTVNFDRLSPTYESRLLKYVRKGVSIMIPNFDKTKIDIDFFLMHSIERRKIINNNNKYLGKIIIAHMSNKYKRNFWLSDRQDDKDDEDYNKQGNGHHMYIGKLISQINKYKEKQEKNSNLPGEPQNPSITQNKENNIAPLNKTLNNAINNLNEQYICCNTKTNKTINYKINMIFAEQYHDYMTTDIYNNDNFYLIHHKIQTDEDINNLLDIPSPLYNFLNCVMPVTIPQKYEVKTVNPGEQMTNTFHSIVLDDVNKWYECPFYDHGTGGVYK